MKKKSLFDAWKTAEEKFNEDNPVVVNEELMGKVHGGGNSAGHVCTVSGECNDDGESCGELMDIIKKIFW